MKKTVVFTLTLLVLSSIRLQTALAQVTLDNGSSVSSVVFLDDGKTLAAVGSKIKLWDVVTHENITTFEISEIPDWRSITSKALSPDGALIALAGVPLARDSGNVGLWDVATQQNITLDGHQSRATLVAFSSDGTRLVSASGDEIKLWDTATHTNTATFEVDLFDDITSVAFSPDGTLLVSGGDRGRVKLWDVATQQNIATLTGHTGRVISVVFSHDGTLLASTSEDDTAKLWDVAAQQNIATLGGTFESITSISFSPDGTLLASGGDTFFDVGVKLWDIETKESIANLEGHAADVNSVSFSPDGTLLASGSSDGTVKLWNIIEWTSTLERLSGNDQEGIIDTALANPLVVEVKDRSNNPLSDVQVTFTVTRGEGLLGGKFTVAEVTTDASGKATQTLTLGPIPGPNSVEVSVGSKSVTFKAEGVSPYQLVKISGDEQQGTFGTVLANPLVVEVRDREDNPLPDLQVKFTVTPSEGLLSDRYTVKHVITDANGRASQTLTLGYAITNSVEVSIEYESVRFSAVGNSAPHIATLRVGAADNPTSVAFSPDGTILASGSGATVRLWDVETHTNIATLEGHTDDVTSVVFSSNETLLASGSSDDTVKLWDVQTHTNIATLEGHTHDVTSVEFSPDGTILASGAWDGIIKVWNVATKENIATFGGFDAAILGGWLGGWHAPVSFSPDGTTLAFGAGNSIKLWDVATKKNIATIEAHPEGVVSVDFSHDGTILASGSGQEIKLWNVETRENIATSIQGAEVNFFSVSFSPVGMMLAYPLDNRVVLWDVKTDAPIAALRGHTNFVWSVSFSSDGTILASGASDGTAKLWDVAEARRLTPTLIAPTPTVRISPSSMPVPAPGEQFTLSLNIADGKNVAGYQATVSFDRTALRHVESANGDYLPANTFFGDPIIDSDYPRENLTLSANTFAGVGVGDGTLATLTFEVIDFRASTLTLSQVYLADPHGNRWEAATESGEVTIPPEPAEKIFGDINRDGVVNIQDLAIVGSRFGKRGQNSADVNGDGLVDIADLVLVAGAFGGEAAAPLAQPQVLELLTASQVKQWLTQAQQLVLTDSTYLRGITVLEQLFAALIPKETVLLANYPNPFNPETWIPYQLAKPANVTLTIYAVDGQVVRRLALGYQPAGWYQTRSRSAYWDGRDEFGEPTTSGIYFYTLTAGEFAATRKMLILK